MNKKTIYISGPISDPATGQPRDGWQKEFLETEARLRAMGFYVINPVDIAREVDDAFKWRCRYITGPEPFSGEPRQPSRANYIMACLQRMQMAHDVGMLHGVYVLGKDGEARQSIGVSMELQMATLLHIPIYGDNLDSTSFYLDCNIEIVDGGITELLKKEQNMLQDYHTPTLLLHCKHCGKVYQMTALAHLDSDEEFLHEFAMSVSCAALNGEQMEVYYGNENPEWCRCNNNL